MSLHLMLNVFPAYLHRFFVHKYSLYSYLRLESRCLFVFLLDSHLSHRITLHHFFASFLSPFKSIRLSAGITYILSLSSKPHAFLIHSRDHCNFKIYFAGDGDSMDHPQAIPRALDRPSLFYLVLTKREQIPLWFQPLGLHFQATCGQRFCLAILKAFTLTILGVSGTNVTLSCDAYCSILIPKTSQAPINTNKFLVIFQSFLVLLSQELLLRAPNYFSNWLMFGSHPSMSAEFGT